MSDALEQVTLETLENYDTQSGIEEFLDSEHVDPDVGQTKKFLGDYWDLFMKEYDITNVVTHCFEAIRPDLHKKLDQRDTATNYYPDTFFMTLIDQKGNSINFQRYNGHMIVMREIGKIRHKDGEFGGKFEVIVYEKQRDENGSPYLTVTAEPAYFTREQDLMRARGDAIKYMKEVVRYHDLEEGKCQDDCVDVDCATNHFMIKADPEHIPIPFGYHGRQEHFADYDNTIHKEEERIERMESDGQIPHNQGQHLLNLLLISHSYLAAAKHPHAIRHA